MRFFKGHKFIVQAVEAQAEAGRIQAESNNYLLALHITTINSQVLQLKAEFDKIVESQRAIVAQAVATQAGQAALLSALADLLRCRPDIKEPPAEKPGSPMDDLF